jgi:hypothetical protein
VRIVAVRKSEQNSAVLDPWTGVHLSAGLALGLMNVPFGRSLACAVAYEVIEQFVERHEMGQEIFDTTRPEDPLNAVVDVAVFAVGHWLGSAWNRT